MDRISGGRGDRRGRGGGRKENVRGKQQRGGEKGDLSPSTILKVSEKMSKVQISKSQSPVVQHVPQTGACAFPHEDTETHTPHHIDKPSSSSLVLIPSGNIPPNRPCYGDIGNNVQVILLNFFKVKIPSITIHQYDVKIYDLLQDGSVGERNISEKYACNMIMCSLSRRQLEHHFPVYDGASIMYCKANVQGKYKVVWRDSDDENRERKHLVVLKHTAYVDLSVISKLTLRSEQFPSRDEREIFLSQHQAATNAVDAIFRQFASLCYTPIGSRLYRDTEYCDLGGGLCLWEGFSQSLRPGEKQAYLNMDMSYCPIIKSLNVPDFLLESLNLRSINDLMHYNLMKKAANKLSMLNIYVEHLSQRKKFRIKGWGSVFLAPASIESFLFEGKNITVKNYFKMKYNIELDYPNLPCLDVGKGDKVIAMPMEVCFIKPGQMSRTELTGSQKRNMIDATCNPPRIRFDDINYFADRVLSNKNNLLKHFQINICDGKMVEATAKRLPPPIIRYAGENIKGAVGEWSIRGKHFFNPIPIKVWAIVHFSGRVGRFNFKTLIDEIQIQSKEKGMLIERPVNEKEIDIFSTNLRRYGLVDINELLEWTLRCFGQELQMILCVLDSKIFGKFRGEEWDSESVYSRIKLVGDTELSISTQCIDEKNAIVPKGSTIGGLCLKMNAKQGGINHFAVVEETKSLLSGTMVMGADVNHPRPGPGREEFPSIAAGCVALDKHISRYYSTCRFQKNKNDSISKHLQEVILDFETMSSELLRAYMQANMDNKPERILYYRVGVSESQFQAVIDYELTALKRACQKLAKGYNPPVTLVCVQKRHHTRMFDAVKPIITNVEPGTYLDNTVTHPFEYDFYLCSHIALKGTVKAAHYHVLHDGNRFTPNQLYTITYQLCYSFARCTKSVSIPPPVYYADLIAYRYYRYFDPRVVRGKDSALIDWDRYRKDVQARVEPGKMFWA